MINSAAKILKEKTNFIVTTHSSPDGDAVGSVTAIASALKGAGKDVSMFITDKVPQEFTFLPHAGEIMHELPLSGFDAFIAVDCANIDRIGNGDINLSNYGTVMNIDHHKSNAYFGDINVVEKDACSTGFIIYKIIEAAGMEIDYDIAISIYTTILVDTGSFRYSNASAEAFRVAAKMIEKGVNPWSVAEKVYESQPLNRIILLKMALSSMEIFYDDKFAAMTITQDMLNAADADFDITDGFINYPRSIKGIELALLFKELEPCLYKLGLRSKGAIDVSELAGHFGGGGHINAAGCTIKGDMVRVKKEVYDYTRDFLSK